MLTIMMEKQQRYSRIIIFVGLKLFTTAIQRIETILYITWMDH